MAINCEKAKRALDSYHDRQLRGRKFDDMSEHLRQCESCSGELEKLQRISRALKERYEGAALGEKDFSRVWAGVDAAIDAQEGRPAESLLDRLTAILWIPRPAWAAVAAVAVLIVMVFAYMPGEQPSTLAADDCIIDSVEAENCDVMVYEIGDSKMKVIWIMGQYTGETVEQTGATS
jgi:hypothetical protein